MDLLTRMTSGNIELFEAVKVIASVLLGFVFTAWLVFRRESN